MRGTQPGLAHRSENKPDQHTQLSSLDGAGGEAAQFGNEGAGLKLFSGKRNSSTRGRRDSALAAGCVNVRLIALIMVRLWRVNLSPLPKRTSAFVALIGTILRRFRITSSHDRGGSSTWRGRRG
jgi:hypothetical protein